MKNITDLRKEYRQNGLTKQILEENRQYLTSLSEVRGISDGRFSIVLEGFLFECFYHEKKGSEYLYVMLNGARRAANNATPIFARWSYCNVMNGSLLCIDDPMFYQYPDLLLGWYYGRKDRSALAVSMAIVDAVAKGRKVIFVGSSGGGTAAIHASCLSGGLSISINPQIYIAKFPLAADFVRITGMTLEGYDPLSRNDLGELISSGKGKHLILINVLDKACWNQHVGPLCDSLKLIPEWGGTQKSNICLWTFEAEGLPRAHNSVDTAEVFPLIEKVGEKFLAGSLTDEDFSFIRDVNEVWREIYRERAEKNREVRTSAPLREKAVTADSKKKGLPKPSAQRPDPGSKFLCDIYWSQVYHDTIAGSKWLLDASVSPGGPGRWAAGYNLLYPLYRILDEFHPMHILELGLGQSTKLTAQYMRAFHARHLVVEHDREWAEFFRKGWPQVTESGTLLCITDLQKESYQGAEYVSYQHFEQIPSLMGHTAELILIDGPFGGNSERARRDIVKLLPEFLSPDFAILVDDCGRKGEQNLVEELKGILRSHKIAFAEGKYQAGAGQYVQVLASASWKFATTL